MKKLISLGLALALLFGLTVPTRAAGLSNFQQASEYTEGQFRDVPAGSRWAANVRTACGYGIMGGKSADYFDTEGSVTIGQAVAMACRIHSTYWDSEADFSGGSPWYAPYADYALEYGILTQGYADYSVPLSRAAFAMILGAALPDEALQAVNVIEEGAVPDVPAGSGFHDAVYRLYRAGILTGNDNAGTFGPYSAVSRGAAAAIVSRMADPSLRQSFTLKKTAFKPVPMKQLANLKSLRKRANDAELTQAYNAAAELVTPLADLSREEQLFGVATLLRQMFDEGMSYSSDSPHYNDPYGYFILKTASCAGCTRATGLCLNILDIPYEHVNENQYSHQWCRVNVNGTYWICDAYGLYCGPEPAPYQHPYF